MMEKYSPYYVHNLQVLDDLMTGDLVEFSRGLYSHWAVYLGNGKLAHLAGDDNDGIDACVKPEHMFTICGIKFSKAKVCIDDFWKVAAESKAKKNNSKDGQWRPLSCTEIVCNAKAKLGRIGYNLMYSNCEHFAKWCRYGIEKSDQIDNVLTGAMIGVASGLTLGLVYAIAKYFKNDEKEEEEKAKPIAQ